jgi:hypothetical protein
VTSPPLARWPNSSAAGQRGFLQLARELARQAGDPTADRQPHWSITGVRQLLRNPVYLGQARSGKYVLEGAHEPLVSRADFDAAQATRTLLQAATVRSQDKRYSAG